MALMERVAMLMRANVNDLIDRAEDPEKMLRQLVLDMENQLLQVKTQVAIAIADQHLLEKKRKEQDDLASEWSRKAELAVGKGQDDLARAALERSLSHTQMGEGFAQQYVDQTAEADALRVTYTKLEAKLKQTEAQCEMMAAQARRARMVSKANAATAATADAATKRTSPLQRLKAKLQNAEAENAASREMLTSESFSNESLEDRFAVLERDEKVERLLGELKQKQARMLEAG
ncbi:PspA/IM30 family protein [Granulicella cerasi]|uniref:PspA/IM30 family protein n=1 Tax=Granulicella cerasi TaxID=741063 RepID=A0ABW1Z9D8_9BACT|nr:PspA/IM30 family protein [Granulicella cerasi]